MSKQLNGLAGTPGQMKVAETENRPRPKKEGLRMTSGSAAASPHIPTMILLVAALADEELEERRTDGW